MLPPLTYQQSWFSKHLDLNMSFVCHYPSCGHSLVSEGHHLPGRLLRLANQWSLSHQGYRPHASKSHSTALSVLP